MRQGIQMTYATSFVYELDYFDEFYRILVKLVLRKVYQGIFNSLTSPFDLSKTRFTAITGAEDRKLGSKGFEQ